MPDADAVCAHSARPHSRSPNHRCVLCGAFRQGVELLARSAQLMSFFALMSGVAAEKTSQNTLVDVALTFLLILTLLIAVAGEVCTRLPLPLNALSELKHAEAMPPLQLSDCPISLDLKCES